jgi:hypothetical protein
MATLNGVDIFHLCTVATRPNPVAVQTNDYPGVNGLEELRLGTRGRTSTVDGYLLGMDVASLNSAEIAGRSYVVDAGAYTFQDNYGNSWSNVRLVSFDVSERVQTCASAFVGGTGYCRKYTATLLHLS